MLKVCLVEMIKMYIKVLLVIKGFLEQLDIEKFYDVYDISDFDIFDVMQGFLDCEFDDLEFVKILKIVVVRFYIIRKIFLCLLFVLEVIGDNMDFLWWLMVVESFCVLIEVMDEGLFKVW